MPYIAGDANVVNTNDQQLWTIPDGDKAHAKHTISILFQ
jgi:hypothetical protein